MDLNTLAVAPARSAAHPPRSTSAFIDSAQAGRSRVLLWSVITLLLLVANTAWAQQATNDALKKALELHQSGHYAEAIEQYRIFLKAHPDAGAVRSNLGAALAHEGRYPEAIQEYKEALKSQSSNVGIRLNLALAYYKMSEINEAVKEFEDVYGLQAPDDPERRRVVLLLSECYLRLGQEEKVVALLDPLADTAQEDVALEYLLGTALLHEGHEERGALMIQRILRKGDTAEAHMLMAYTRMQSNNKKAASEEVERALALNPKLPEAYTLQGRIAFLNADLNGAETSFRKALDLDSSAYDSLLWLGTLLRQEGRFKDSQSYLERALQQRPDDARSRYQFALLCSDRGDDKRAAALLEALIKQVPAYIEAHRSLSAVYFRLGRTEEGKKEREIAENLDATVQSHDLQRGRSMRK